MKMTSFAFNNGLFLLISIQRAGFWFIAYVSYSGKFLVFYCFKKRFRIGANKKNLAWVNNCASSNLTRFFLKI
jgi:hypothetical protein